MDKVTRGGSPPSQEDRRELEHLASEQAMFVHARQSQSMMAIAGLVAAWTLRAQDEGNYVRLYLVGAFVCIAVFASVRSNMLARIEKKFTIRMRHFRGWVHTTERESETSSRLIDSKWLNDPPPHIFLAVAVASAAILADQLILVFGVR